MAIALVAQEAQAEPLMFAFVRAHDLCRVMELVQLGTVEPLKNSSGRLVSVP